MMDKFAPVTPCPYHGPAKTGAKHTNVYNKAGHLHQQHNEGAGAGGSEGAPKTMEPIWDIVSGLAQALNDARDQLASLMQVRGNSPPKSAFARGHQSGRSAAAHQQYGGNGRACVDSHGGRSIHRSKTPRCYSAPHSRGRGGHHGEEREHHTRNIHRSHAHGYCAFGRNTEFKERMHHNRGGGGRRIHSSHGGGGGDDGHGGYGIRLQGGTGACGIKVIPNGKSYTCVRDRSKKGIHLMAKMKNCNMNVETDGERFGPDHPMKIHFTSPSKLRIPAPFMNPAPEVKRYCVGTQYANLLREEAHQLRDKRIMDQGRTLRSNWKNA